jgi:hypothetical protein
MEHIRQKATNVCPLPFIRQPAALRLGSGALFPISLCSILIAASDFHLHWKQEENRLTRARHARFFQRARATMNQPQLEATTDSVKADSVRAALIERLAKIRPVPAHIRAAQSLQPTPEAGKTRVARLRRKHRVLLQRAKRALASELNAPPPAPDPLAP